MRLLIAALAFAFFIVCPRMAGITSVISRSAEIELVELAVIGTLISIPLVVVMVYIFSHYAWLQPLHLPSSRICFLLW